MKSYKLSILSVAVGLLGGLSAPAQFNYNNSDLLLGFRTPGGSLDLLVDIGSVSLYAGATSPITISGNYYTSQQLTDAGLTLNNLYFSVFGDVSPGYPTNNGPYNTLWVTRPETPPGTLSAPWAAQSSAQLATSRSRIESIAAGGVFISATSAPGADNTSSTIITPDIYSQSGDISYNVGIGSGGNFQGNFGSNNDIENNTPGSFNSGTVISDLYEMMPNQDGARLGSFVLNSSGVLTFNPTSAPEPATWAMLGLGMLGLAGWRRAVRKS